MAQIKYDAFTAFAHYRELPKKVFTKAQWPVLLLSLLTLSWSPIDQFYGKEPITIQNLGAVKIYLYH